MELDLPGGLTVETEISFLVGSSRREGPHRFPYEQVRAGPAGALIGTIRGRMGGASFQVTDSWQKGESGVRLSRELRLRADSGWPVVGLNAVLTIRPGDGGQSSPGPWKFFVPAACYDSCPNEAETGRALVSEERAAAPLVMAFDESRAEAIILLRETPARETRRRSRQSGVSAFLHETQVGSVGYARRKAGGPALIACLPYAEEPSSRMLGRSLQPFAAFLPSEPEQRITAAWLVRKLEARSFDEACFAAWQLAWRTYAPRLPDPDLGLGQCVQARVARLADLVRHGNGFTGIALNFDPRVGTDAPPSGYGTAFNSLNSKAFPSILEYGFTGRQLNNAYMLHVLGADLGEASWRRHAEGIASSFLDRCALPSGFLHTLYDLRRQAAISPFGDEVGSLLHYGVPAAPTGNYARNMAEAGFDLCLLSERLGDPRIRGAASRLARFFLETQNADGSWHRAYTPEGKPVTRPEEWFGGTGRATRSSTSTVIPFLVKLHGLTGEKSYLDGARRAGDWLLREMVGNIDYRGGTLDNPNIVDKEGMAYPMMALMALFEATKNPDYRAGALKAGGLAMTWNCLWNVPFEEGTRLADHGFSSAGWGGISILWGAGVVDNYSLWFLSGWRSLAELTGNPVLADAARLILFSTQQMLALPGKMHGLAAPGMQEEGFACSDQGVDEGMIRKGDTWGALGWVFAAGTWPVWQDLLRAR